MKPMILSLFLIIYLDSKQYQCFQNLDKVLRGREVSFETKSIELLCSISPPI